MSSDQTLNPLEPSDTIEFETLHQLVTFLTDLSEVPEGNAKAGCWLQTYTGGIVHPLNPTQDEIRIQDIAGSLSKLCRFGGHTNKFYSVAEHCVLLSRAVQPKYKLTTLLHDASEAYLVDIPRPLKPWLAGYKEIENKLLEVIFAKFGAIWPIPDGIKQMDTAILSDERLQTMANTNIEPRLWGNMYPPLGISLEFWDPPRAEFEYASAFHHYRRL